MRRVVAFCSSIVLAGVIVVAAVGASGSAQVVARIDTGLGPCSETGGLGSLWVGVGGAGTLVRIDPATNTVTDRIAVGAGASGVAVGSGAVWATSTIAGTVSRIDPSTRRVTATVAVGGLPRDVAVGAGSVWVTADAR